MNRRLFATLATVGLFAVALNAGCQREVMHDRDVHVRDDGTVRTEETRVTEDADGTIRVRESERTSPR